MKLIIVEDEPRLRLHLANDIGWEEHGIDVVGLAASAEEALELVERKRPDILLLDVQMSGMSGIQLAKEIQAGGQLVKMIVLSGHDNFEYAQSAMAYGVSQYLLKPAGDTEILEAVLSAAGELRAKLDELHNHAALKQKWTQHLPYLQEMFLRNWLHGQYSAWELKRRSGDVLLNLQPQDYYCAAIVDIDPLPEDEERFSGKDTSLLQVSVKSIARECLAEGAVWMFTDFDGSTVIVFRSRGTEDREGFLHHVNASIEKLLDIVRQIFKLTASSGISACTDEPLELNKLYEQARQALQKRLVYGNGIAATYQERFELEGENYARPDLERELEIGLEKGNEEAALKAMDKLWTSVMDGAEHVEQVRESILYFNSLLIRLIQQRGCSVKEVAGEDFPYMQNLQTIATKEQMRDYLHRLIRRFVQYLMQKRGAAGHRTVEAVLVMIEESIHEDLTLHTVSEKLFINSSYLSRLFKQEQGKPFSAYVLERKMERAKASLLGGAKVYDAASSVGYRDVSYFTKVFRKYWGITPGEMAKTSGT
ncbi:response regulator [Paenibacillus sp. J5C_2022]|uniref:response regulator n=1 Tax=Paenibacillus sp. J5C2022 TaxID=2977129 RepID=UPI0021CEEEDA|nr:response regulator [Paenibacillus sp. J5C2022]MCU6712676.1 response regulator [Paenibacillus sp. J5C2022]